jgi:hypothetical protein
MPSRRARPPKPPGASLAAPTANEQAEIETMLKRLEELRRAASNSELRAAYQAAIDGLDGVLYRLAMLRPPKRTPLSATVSSPPPAFGCHSGLPPRFLRDASEEPGKTMSGTANAPQFGRAVVPWMTSGNSRTSTDSGNNTANNMRNSANCRAPRGVALTASAAAT